MKVVFLDRDGVINRFPGHRDYVTKIKNFHFLPGSLNAIRELTQKGYHIFVVSNQAGVTRGVYSQKKLDQINRYMLKHVIRAGGKIRKTFYCIHLPDENCDCRKPKIGSIKKAFALLKKHPKDAQRSFFVGDTESDMEAGKKAGCQTIFVLSGKDNRRHLRSWSVKPDYIANNLLEATKIITNENSHHSRLRRRRA